MHFMFYIQYCIKIKIQNTHPKAFVAIKMQKK